MKNLLCAYGSRGNFEPNNVLSLYHFVSNRCFEIVKTFFRHQVRVGKPFTSTMEWRVEGLLTYLVYSSHEKLIFLCYFFSNPNHFIN